MNIQYHKNFKKQYKKLPLKIRAQFKDRLRLFIQDPFNNQLHNHAVEGVYPHCRSINITGDYRALFKQENDVVIFIIIGTHSQLYS